MARSVILTKTPRCDRCNFVPRWCICEGFAAVAGALQVDVLMHRREWHRPTSTGRLIKRILPSSRLHQFVTETPPARDSIVNPSRMIWILHPRGEIMPPAPSPENMQVILLDGSWREAARMTQTIATWGRLVRLPMTEPSRYWLRKQQDGDSYSTVEALIFLFKALGLTDEATRLHLQFELHVYAGLRSRGDIPLAEKFLAGSLLSKEMPVLLEQLQLRRANVCD